MIELYFGLKGLKILIAMSVIVITIITYTVFYFLNK